MNTKSLPDATCQVEQAQTILSMWLESVPKDCEPDLPRLIGSILTLLHGVPEAMDAAEDRLAKYIYRDYQETKA